MAEIDGFPGYAARIEDNLLPGITPEFYCAEYTAGAGDELGWAERRGRLCPPKLHAAHSSSALVVNAFAPWKSRLSELLLCGERGFSLMRFEARLPTGLGGVPPHVDVLAEAVGGTAVAIESKATEFLQAHPAVFAESYRLARWPECVASYTAAMECLRANPTQFRHLDAAQLIKHALGLGARYGEHPVTLFYVFWEPGNRDEFPEFDLHRAEVQKFGGLVAGSPVRFAWTTYRDLWQEWARGDRQWLREHAGKLSERYLVRA
jgi:hypothetical protein